MMFVPGMEKGGASIGSTALFAFSPTTDDDPGVDNGACPMTTTSGRDDQAERRETQDVGLLVFEWAQARSACVAEPIGSPGYRDKLNRLSNAKDALSRAAFHVTNS